jgi:putative transposase
MIAWSRRPGSGRRGGCGLVAADSLYTGFRFPEEIISHAVWHYYRFLLSLRDVQELLLERGIVVSHETIRAWCEPVRT